VLNESDLSAYVDRHFQRTVFRLETLDRYTVDSDTGNVTRYLNGDPAPAMDVKGPWLQRLTQERAEGKRRSRVHVLHTPLSDYLRYECEWGYAYTAPAGEDIFILDLAQHPRPQELIDEDFLLLDDEHVVVVHYDDEGRFLGGRPLPAEEALRYRQCRDAALAAAVPFEAFWQARPQDWRVNRAQAGT